MGALIITCLLTFNGAVNPFNWCEKSIQKRSSQGFERDLNEVYELASNSDYTETDLPNEFEISHCLINHTPSECSFFEDY